MMKTIVFAGLLIGMITSCERGGDDVNHQYVAEIVGFDLNCSTCILSFPDDSLNVKGFLGESRNNYYQTVNLLKGNFRVGQMIKVRVRKAEDNELKACITLYPSYPYKNIYVSEYEDNNDLTWNDTIFLGYGQCLNDFKNHEVICFDTVLTDSRCPENVVCVWAGEAVARFGFKTRQNLPVSVDLHAGTMDTVINEFKFSFLDLLPYPNTEIQTSPEDYMAKIVVKRR